VKRSKRRGGEGVGYTVIVIVIVVAIEECFICVLMFVYVLSKG